MDTIKKWTTKEEIMEQITKYFGEPPKGNVGEILRSIDGGECRVCWRHIAESTLEESF